MKKKVLTDEEKRARRKLYYERENEKRKAQAEERRKIRLRKTTNPMPTVSDVSLAWSRRDMSKEDMILFGGMIHDLECFLDNSLVFNDEDEIGGRRGGIRGWLKGHMPHLLEHYKVIMNYKAMAKKLRQVAGIHDPTPTSELLKNPGLYPVMREIQNTLTQRKSGQTFEAIMSVLDSHLKPLYD